MAAVWLKLVAETPAPLLDVRFENIMFVLGTLEYMLCTLILQAKGPKVSTWRTHDVKSEKPADESTDLYIREMNF